MSKRSVPYLFLAFLLAVLLFILGVRYGQRVEQVNKTVTYLVSIPPTATVAPTAPPLAFTEYTHAGCRVSFLVPNSLTKTTESSTSAVFADEHKALAIALACEKKQFIQEKGERSVALTKTIRAYETDTKDTVSYRFYHSITGKVVTLTALKQYIPLLQKSLQYSN